MNQPLRLAYFIIVHKNPAQLARLIKRLTEPTTTFYLYVDGKADLEPFRAALHQLPGSQVVWLTPREPISWGNFSLSAAYLSGFQTILLQDPQPDFILTLSGQDYPLVPNATIHQWLTAHLNQSIIDHSIITQDDPHILQRVQQYYLAVNRHHSIIYPHPLPDTFKRKLFNRTIRLSGLLPLPRRMPLGHQLYFGTNWFQLKPLAARYLVDFARENPAYVRFFRTTYVPEESFFHTVLANASESVRGPLLNQRLTFMQWDRPPGSYSLPIRLDELPALLSSGKLFARKFELQSNDVLLDHLDRNLEQGPAFN